MSTKANSNNGSNNSFSHAFLPGLILGLIVGAVAGAFLPDFLGGPSIPSQVTPGGQGDATHSRDDRQSEDADPEVEKALEDARQDMEDKANQGVDEEEAAEGEETPPAAPSDG